MVEYEYIKKSLSDFRKSFPNFVETKKSYGKKSISVFFDFTMLDNITDIPNDIKQSLKTDSEALEYITRTNTLSFGNIFISQENGLQYYIDFDGITYDIIDDTKDKMLYSVIKIRSVRFAAYEANIYGYYNNLPIEANSYNWSENIGTPMYELHYRKELA
jgi:hypothetical protein